MSLIKSEQIASGLFLIKNNRGTKGWFHSIKMNEDFYYDSFWELIKMRLLDLDENVIKWTKRHGIKIKYGNKHYVPDFLITTINGEKILEEIKGYEKKDKKIAKFEAGQKFCKQNNYIYKVTEQKELNIECLLVFGAGIKKLFKEFKILNKMS